MNLPLLGERTVEQFLARYWQKRPLVVRQALPALKGLITRSQLFRLASRENVETRVVSSSRGWKVSHGPFRAGELSAMPARNWTLLVQGLNLHHRSADQLLRQFSFIPYARLDDVMVSYAVPGGGVGPHTDSYDVFLIQTQGRRIWRTGKVGHPRFKPGLDLRILDGFSPAEEYLMEPGDLLYLPPGWGHDGTAMDECMTCSIGFRAPSNKELLSEFLLRMSERIERPGLYHDPDLKLQSKAALLPTRMIDSTAELVSKLRFRRHDIERFLGEYLSEPKPSVVFNRPRAPLRETEFVRRLQQCGLRLDPRTIMLYRGGHLFINGETLGLSGSPGNLLATLANARQLAPLLFKQVQPIRALLHEWYLAGWAHPGDVADRQA